MSDAMVPAASGAPDVVEGLSRVDMRDLTVAVATLENPGFVARLTDLVGRPIEILFDSLPGGASEKINRVVRASLSAALEVALRTMKRRGRKDPANWRHKVAGGLVGAAGGAFGLGGLAVELPVSTSIILRSVADIARSEGEDVGSVESRLACLEVFALGGRSHSDDAAESGYYAVRAALARAVTEAAKYIARQGVVEEGAPVIVRLLSQIASRFNTVVAEKILAQGPPVVGALGGATVNLLFIGHFQAVAKGHFTVRRLERGHGRDVIERHYRQILAAARRD